MHVLRPRLILLLDIFHERYRVHSLTMLEAWETICGLSADESLRTSV